MPSIDKEFKEVIPPLSEEEYQQLEANILKDGIRDSITVWDAPDGERYIVDGHNRYEIAQKHSLPYNIRRMEFPDRDAVIRWIILNQFGRRNLSKYDRSILALKLKPMIAEQQKQKQIEGGKKKVQQKSVEPTTTQKELAKVAGVSHDTIHKVETIRDKASEDVKAKVKSGEMSINEGYHKTIQKDAPKKPTMADVYEKHQEFQERTKEAETINLAEARLDKDRVKILANDYKLKLSKALHNLDTLASASVGNLIGIGIETCIKQFTYEEKKQLIQELSITNQNIVRLAKMIGGK